MNPLTEAVSELGTSGGKRLAENNISSRDSKNFAGMLHKTLQSVSYEAQRRLFIRTLTKKTNNNNRGKTHKSSLA